MASCSIAPESQNHRLAAAAVRAVTFRTGALLPSPHPARLSPPGLPTRSPAPYWRPPEVSSRAGLGRLPPPRPSPFPSSAGRRRFPDTSSPAPPPPRSPRRIKRPGPASPPRTRRMARLRHERCHALPAAPNGERLRAAAARLGDQGGPADGLAFLRGPQQPNHHLERPAPAGRRGQSTAGWGAALWGGGGVRGRWEPGAGRGAAGTGLRLSAWQCSEARSCLLSLTHCSPFFVH